MPPGEEEQRRLANLGITPSIIEAKAPLGEVPSLRASVG